MKILPALLLVFATLQNASASLPVLIVPRANFLRYDWQTQGANRGLASLNWAPVVNGCPHISPGAMGFVRLID